MSPDRSGRREPGEESVGGLAAEILRRIVDGDLPAGFELDPARLAGVFDTTPARTARALEQLEDAGATVRLGDIWMVRTDRPQPGREVLNRAGPLLRAITVLAVGRITPAEAAGLLAAYDRFSGLSGDPSQATRAEGYRVFMRRLADSAGSSFQALAMETVLAETADMLDRMLDQRMLPAALSDPDDELARLARALMASDGQAAADAIDDHIIILGRYLDQLAG